MQQPDADASVRRDYAVGTQYVTRVTLVQSRDQVVGTLYTPYPGVAADDSAARRRRDAVRAESISADALPMTGTLVGPTPTSPPVGTISDWRTEIDTTQPILRGSYTEVTTTTSGTTSITWEFVGLTRAT